MSVCTRRGASPPTTGIVFDTRHVVYRPTLLTPEALEKGYWNAYRDFYRWGSILQGAMTKPTLLGKARHLAYAGGWKKLEPLWDWVIRARRVNHLLPMLENVLAEFGQRSSSISQEESASVFDNQLSPALSNTSHNS